MNNDEFESNNIADKEKEILNSYMEEIEDSAEIEENIPEEEESREIEEVKEELESFEKEDRTKELEESTKEELIEEKPTKNKRQKTKVEKIINIIFNIAITILILVTIDILLVTKFEMGPFLAIPLKTYKDGGTKEYYGLGYKVIKYHQTQGRRDIILGSWSLKYNTTPIEIDDIDLSIEFREDTEGAFNKYINEFVRINSTLVDKYESERKIALAYYEEGEKYSLEIICNVSEDEKKFADLEPGKETTIIGTIYSFEEKNSKNPNRLYVKNCFAEQ